MTLELHEQCGFQYFIDFSTRRRLREPEGIIKHISHGNGGQLLCYSGAHICDCRKRCLMRNDRWKVVEDNLYQITGAAMQIKRPFLNSTLKMPTYPQQHRAPCRQKTPIIRNDETTYMPFLSDHSSSTVTGFISDCWGSCFVFLVWLAWTLWFLALFVMPIPYHHKLTMCLLFRLALTRRYKVSTVIS